MAVYYKFKSARDFDSIAMDGPFISVGTLKEKVFESKHLGRGTDFDLLVTNAQTNEEYLDEAMLIPKNTSVLIRRVPGRPRMAIVTEQEPKMEPKVEETTPEKSGFMGADPSFMQYTEDNECDEFGNDLYSIPEAVPVQSSSLPIDVPPTNKADEDSKIKALIDTPALDWQHQGADGFGPGRGFGRGMNGRMGGRGFGMERKTPPQGYVCHRCKTPGHFIQHCPTNGDPNFDVRRVKPPTGIPKSMLMATPDGSYALPSGAVAVLRPNEAAFEKEIEGLPSTRYAGDLPPELHCPLCKEVMKDAVLTSKCCFTSFCDKCIRDHIISKSRCVCGVTNVLADDLLPNKTLRDTINRILESGNSSAENPVSIYQVQDMESARCPQPRIPSPTFSAASKEQQPSAVIVETLIPNAKETTGEMNPIFPQQKQPENVRTVRVADISEATHESMSVKEPASQGSAQLADEEVQQKLAPSEAAKKKKKKKVRMPPNDMWKTPQDFAAENYMMHTAPSAYDPYWGGMPPGMNGFMPPYHAGPMPFMGYGMGPMDMPFGAMPPDHFAAQGYMMPAVPPHRDLADFGMGMNNGPPVMSREEFEARKADLRRRRESERRVESGREFPRDREFGREVSSGGGGGGDVSSIKSKPMPPHFASGGDPHHSRHRQERSPERSARDMEAPPLPRPSKRKPDNRDRDSEHYHYERDRDRDRESQHRESQHRHHHRRPEVSTKSSSETTVKPTQSTTTSAAAAAAEAERKHKTSVFSRISFPEREALAKKRKLSSSGEAGAGAAAPSGSSAHHKSSSANGYYDDHKSTSTKAVSVPSSGGRKSSTAAAMDYESSDDDRHFKRKPSRYEPSPPPPPAAWEEDVKHSSRAPKEKERHSSSRHR